MADTKYLKKLRQGWYLAITVPRGLRGRPPFERKTTIIKSLGTRYIREAQRLRWAAAAEVQAAFERARTHAPLSPSEVEQEALRAYTAILEALALAKRLQPRRWAPRWPGDTEVAEEVDGLSEVIDHFHDALGESREGSGARDYSMVAEDIAKIAEARGVKIEPGGDTFRDLAEALLRARVAAFNGRIALIEGKPSEPPPAFSHIGIDPITLQPVAATRPAIRGRGKGGMTFSEVAALRMDELQRDKATRLTGQTRRRQETICRLFAEFTGDPPLTAISRSVASRFIDAIAKLNPTWGKSPRAKGLPWERLVAEFGNGDAQIANQTLNHYVNALSAVFKHARKLDFDGANPFEDQRRKYEPDPWEPFTTDELNAIFGSPSFAEGERLRPAKHSVESALLWVPLIGLYSGMRLNEICQLHTTDLQREPKIWFFRVAEGTGQRVKTDAAVRSVPVHSALMRCGLLDYRAGLSDGLLFPGLKPHGLDGKLSEYVSTEFTTYRRSVGVVRPHVSFHSFRKNVTTALDNAGVVHGDIAAVLGHERGFTLSTYSKGLELRRLQEIVEKIRYPGLRLAHLYARSD
jgi:integrase